MTLSVQSLPKRQSQRLRPCSTWPTVMRPKITSSLSWMNFFTNYWKCLLMYDILAPVITWGTFYTGSYRIYSQFLTHCWQRQKWGNYGKTKEEMRLREKTKTPKRWRPIAKYLLPTWGCRQEEGCVQFHSNRKEKWNDGYNKRQHGWKV